MAWGDPFAPKSYRARTPPRAPDLPPLVRLRRVGLTHDDEAVVRARWAALSNDERFEAMTAMENLDDDELRRQVEEMREEAAATAALSEYDTPALTDVPDATVDEVLGWVGDDAARAAAALAAEEGRPQPRKTLRARLQGLVGG